MDDYYSSFALEVVDLPKGRMAIWTGEVQPLRTDELLFELLDDIDNDRPVYLPGGGLVIHHPHCLVWKHARREWMRKITEPFITYRLRVKYSGGPAHPRAYVVKPFLWPFKNGQFNWKHNLEDGAICGYAPHQNVWDSKQHTVVHFMSHALIWLVRWTVWDQAGVWLGAEEPHDFYHLLRAIKPEDPCHCASGKNYGDCHRQQHLEYVREHPEPKRSLNNRITALVPRVLPSLL